MATIRCNVDEVQLMKDEQLVLVRLPNEDAVEVWSNGRVIYYSDKGATVYSNMKLGPRKSKRG